MWLIFWGVYGICFSYCKGESYYRKEVWVISVICILDIWLELDIVGCGMDKVMWIVNEIWLLYWFIFVVYVLSVVLLYSFEVSR